MPGSRRDPVGPALERVDVEEARPVERHARQHAVVRSSARSTSARPGRRSRAAGARRASRSRSPRRSRCRRDPAAARTGRRTPPCSWRLPSAAGQVRSASRPCRASAAWTASRSSRVAGLDGDVDRAGVEVQLADGVAGHAAAPRGRAGGPASTPPPNRPAPSTAVAAPVDVQPRRARGSAPRRSTRYSSTSAISISGWPSIAVVRRRARGPRSTESAARRATPSSRSSPSARCHATAAWTRWPMQYSSWPELQVAVLAPGREHLDERVEVAVLALRGRDGVDRLVGHRGDARVPRPPELPADALEPLVDVRVEERERPVEHDPERPVAARRRARGEPEVLERADVRPAARNACGSVRSRFVREPLGPEAAGDRDVAAARAAAARPMAPAVGRTARRGGRAGRARSRPAVEEVERLVPAQLAPERRRRGRGVDRDQLDAGDLGEVGDRLDADARRQRGVVRAAGGEPGLGRGRRGRAAAARRRGRPAAAAAARRARRRRPRWRSAGTGRRGRRGRRRPPGPGAASNTSRTGSARPPIDSGWISHDGRPAAIDGQTSSMWAPSTSGTGSPRW